MRTMNCTVCGSHQQRSYLPEGEFTVVACVECGHLYTSPLFSDQEYVTRYQASGDWIKPTDFQAPSGSDKRFEAYAAELAGLIEPGALILEVGCSKGRFLGLMKQRGFDCYGVEPSKDAEVASRLIGEGRIWHGFYDRTLTILADAVAMFEVLEHVPEPYHVTELIFNQLRPGGYFMGSIPNGEFIRLKVWPRRALGLQSLVVPLTVDAGNHINYFSAGGIQRMLQRVGFRFQWVKNAPLDFNYLANRYSPWLKRSWWWVAETVRKLNGRFIGSNIWFLAQKPS
jgi:SAM-dependent methyltransferase